VLSSVHGPRTRAIDSKVERTRIVVNDRAG
jgi:hypothetical protein